MSGRVRSCSSHHRELLTDQWEMAAADPLAASTSGAPAGPWMNATAPGTVASSLRAAGQWCLDEAARAFDSEEWWFRRRFKAEPAAAGERLILGMDGLATLAEIWLNGERLGQSANMFQAHEFDISALVAPANELLIRFTPIQKLLGQKRPRPRWRTPMVAHQQLRWIRTTLLGRTPGWSPPAAPVGPWRGIELLDFPAAIVRGLRLSSRVVGGRGELAGRPRLGDGPVAAGGGGP